jgi:hypothetical protein
MGGPAAAVTVTGFKAAAAPTEAAAAATTTAANKRSTAAANTAVVATSYCQSAKATLPSAAAPQSAAEAAAAARPMRAAAKKEVAAVAGSTEAVTSLSPPALPAKHMRRRPQQNELPGGLEEAGVDRLCAILHLDGDGDASVCSEPATQPSSLESSPSMPPPPSDPSPGKKKCCICNVNDMFNYDYRNVLNVLKSICSRCYTTASDYHLK